jgi:hypothetical protein
MTGSRRPCLSLDKYLKEGKCLREVLRCVDRPVESCNTFDILLEQELLFNELIPTESRKDIRLR